MCRCLGVASSPCSWIPPVLEGSRETAGLRLRSWWSRGGPGGHPSWSPGHRFLDGLGRRGRRRRGGDGFVKVFCQCLDLRRHNSLLVFTFSNL